MPIRTERLLDKKFIRFFGVNFHILITRHLQTRTMARKNQEVCVCLFESLWLWGDIVK